MEKRKLGNSGLAVAPLAFGGNVFGWTVDQPTSFALLDGFVAAGFDFIDTADAYSRWVPGNKGGESETIIGQWLKQRGGRDKIVIATKLGLEVVPGQKGLSKTYMVKAIEASLKRLQTDYIDLYQSHVDDSATPIEETLEAYDTLTTQGKIRAIGASNFSIARLADSLAVSKRYNFRRYDSLQPLYNLYDRVGFEGELAGLCLRENVGVIPYYALASGFLTGKYRAKRDLGQSPRGQRVASYLNDRGMRILAALDLLATRYQAKPGQIAIAWLSAQPAVTAPIASATSLGQLQELIDATRIRLDQDAIAALNRASAE